MNLCTRPDCDQPAYTADPNPVCRRHLIQEQQMPYVINDSGALEGTPDPTPAEQPAKPEPKAPKARADKEDTK